MDTNSRTASIDLSVEVARTQLAGIVDETIADDLLVAAYARAIWSAIAHPAHHVVGQHIIAHGAATALQLFLAGDLPGDDLPPVPLAHILEDRSFLEAARRSGTRLVIPGMTEWPQMLDQLEARTPIALWVRGASLNHTDPAATVTLTGARAATSYGEHVAQQLVHDLASDNVTIVTGASYGIDGAASRAALTAGVRTIAVLAEGVDRPYPTGHTALIDSISHAGSVISENPCGTAPTKWRYTTRARILAALSDATVVVEAGNRSGSLAVATEARDLGRGFGAVPGPVTSASSVGTNGLLRFGATVIASADDIRELVGRAKDDSIYRGR